MALCLVSGGLYAANDALDAERDRQHPVKRDRPVASGRISVAQAWVIAAAFVGLGTALSVWLGLPFLSCVAIYVALQVGYMIWLKHVVIVDMLVIAAGFVMRAIAGAAVIALQVSPWLVICTGLLALFLAAAKRRHELRAARRRVRGSPPGARRVLGRAARQLHGHAVGCDYHVLRAVHLL